MNYQSIAEYVHNRVKNPKSMLDKEQGYNSPDLKSKEQKIIQTVFSKYELSGNVLTIGIRPLGEWG